MFRATGWGVSRDLFASNPGRVIDLSRQGGGLRSEYLGMKGIAQWSLGVDVSSQSDSRVESLNKTTSDTGHLRGNLLVQQLEEVMSAGPFVQLSVAPHSRVTVTAGVRYDYYNFSATDQKLDDGDQSGERTMNAASPSVGLTFMATPTLNVYTNYSTAYQTPTTVELSNRPEGEGGFNQMLEPERIRSFEVGLRGLVQPARLQYEIAVYRSRLLDAFVAQEGADEQTFFSNAAESSRNGVELSLNWQPTSRVSARASYTHQDFTFEEFGKYSGNFEPGVVPNRFFAGVDYTAPFGLRSGASVRWFDSIFANNANTASNWSYAVVDLRFGLDQLLGDTDIRPFVGIDNVFSERYNSSVIVNAWGRRYFEPSPGREIYVGFTIGFGVR
jgi:iron complex outermembrane receptor protein